MTFLSKAPLVFNLNFLDALGIALTNIDDAPINLNGIKLYNFFDTISGILTKLEIHYKEALINSLFQVIGSIDILGNPFGLMKHLGQIKKLNVAFPPSSSIYLAGFSLLSSTFPLFLLARSPFFSLPLPSPLFSSFLLLPPSILLSLHLITHLPLSLFLLTLHSPLII